MDPGNPDFISVNEYMMQLINTNIEGIQNKTLCKTCEMYEMREIESDLTILLEVDYNDMLELLLENDPSLNSNVVKLCEIIKRLRDYIPVQVMAPAKTIAVQTPCAIQQGAK